MQKYNSLYLVLICFIQTSCGYNLDHLNLVKSGRYNLNNLDLSYANLKKINLSNRSLIKTNFTGCCLIEAKFNNSQLTGAIFDNAWIMNAEFDECCMCNTSAKNTNFTKTIIKNSCFMNVKIDGTILRNTDLRTSLPMNTCFCSAADIYGLKIDSPSRVRQRNITALIEQLIQQVEEPESIPTPEKVKNFENKNLPLPKKVLRCNKCTICLDSFKNNEAIACLPCGHLLHKDCANNALSYKAHSLTYPRCPICRLDIKKGYSQYIFKTKK